MEITYSEQAQSDVNFWIKSGNKNIQNKITNLLNAIEADPFKGIGKPEQLKHEMSGKWSRRISGEHRLVYECSEDRTLVKIHSLRGHYK